MQFSKGTLRHVKFGKQKDPPQRVTQCSDPHERSSYAPKLGDRSEEETLKQERCARRVAWEMAKHIRKLDERDKATFYSLSGVWCPAEPSSTKPEERECVVDSGASMHMLSRQDLISAKLDTVRESRNCRQDTHSQHTSVQNSLFTSTERTPRAWLKDSRLKSHGLRFIFVSLKRNCHLMLHMSHPLLFSPAVYHEHIIFLIHSSFCHDTRTHAAQPVQHDQLREHPSASRTSPSSPSRQVAPSRITVA